jgi:hypothetical protein
MRHYLEELARRADVAVLTTSAGECARFNVSEVIADMARLSTEQGERSTRYHDR